MYISPNVPLECVTDGDQIHWRSQRHLFETASPKVRHQEGWKYGAGAQENSTERFWHVGH